MTGCRHEWEAGHFEDAHSGAWAEYACKKCGDLGYEDEVETWNAAMRIAAADIAARDAVIAGLQRKIRGLATMIPPLTPEEAQREFDSFDGPVEPMTEAEIGRIVDEVMNRVARSKGKVHVP